MTFKAIFRTILDALRKKSRNLLPVQKKVVTLQPQKAQVAELVDAHVSGACAARREGSSPFLGTAKSDNRLKINDCRAFVL